jgi:hypothetical protein
MKIRQPRKPRGRTKFEVSYDYKKLTATVREVFCDSGKTWRTHPAFSADDLESLELQVKGYLAACRKTDTIEGVESTLRSAGIDTDDDWTVMDSMRTFRDMVSR